MEVQEGLYWKRGASPILCNSDGQAHVLEKFRFTGTSRCKNCYYSPNSRQAYRRCDCIPCSVRHLHLGPAICKARSRISFLSRMGDPYPGGSRRTGFRRRCRHGTAATVRDPSATAIHLPQVRRHARHDPRYVAICLWSSLHTNTFVDQQRSYLKSQQPLEPVDASPPSTPTPHANAANLRRQAATSHKTLQASSTQRNAARSTQTATPAQMTIDPQNPFTGLPRQGIQHTPAAASASMYPQTLLTVSKLKHHRNLSGRSYQVFDDAASAFSSSPCWARKPKNHLEQYAAVPGS